MKINQIPLHTENSSFTPLPSSAETIPEYKADSNFIFDFKNENIMDSKQNLNLSSHTHDDFISTCLLSTTTTGSILIAPSGQQKDISVLLTKQKRTTLSLSHYFNPSDLDAWKLG